MRIIAGEARGRRVATLKGEDTRPTMERVKEGMFSAVQFWLPGAKVLDLFAGSGQLGLEAVSRGAGSCVFVDDNKEAGAIIALNIESLGYKDKCRVVRGSVQAFLARCGERFDLVLIDPPYRQGHFPGLLGQVAALAAPGAQVLCESEPEAEMPQQVGVLCLEKQYRYGTVMVTRYIAKFEEEDGE